MKIRDVLDEAPADLSDLPIKLLGCEQDTTPDRTHFWEGKYLRKPRGATTITNRKLVSGMRKNGGG